MRSYRVVKQQLFGSDIFMVQRFYPRTWAYCWWFGYGLIWGWGWRTCYVSSEGDCWCLHLHEGTKFSSQEQAETKIKYHQMLDLPDGPIEVTYHAGPDR